MGRSNYFDFSSTHVSIASLACDSARDSLDRCGPFSFAILTAQDSRKEVVAC